MFDSVINDVLLRGLTAEPVSELLKQLEFHLRKPPELVLFISSSSAQLLCRTLCCFARLARTLA